MTRDFLIQFDSEESAIDATAILGGIGGRRRVYFW